ncbi:MAG: hypothetical protein V1784_00040 [bacterium]
MKGLSIDRCGLLLICLTALPLFVGACRHEQRGLPPAIFSHWVHSHEEDTDMAYVYRPFDYPFPRSRGREGFEIKQTGEFVLYRIAPTDGLNRFTGRWKLKGTDTLLVEFDTEEIRSISLRIISCEDGLLKIRK